MGKLGQPALVSIPTPRGESQSSQDPCVPTNQSPVSTPVNIADHHVPALGIPVSSLPMIFSYSFPNQPPVELVKF